MKVLENVLLSDYTTIKIGGKCNRLIFPHDEEELIKTVANLEDVFILGGGE